MLVRPVAVASAVACGDGAADAALAEEAFGALALTGPRRVDARVEAVLRRPRRAPNTPVGALASGAGVSPERLRRLVAQQTETPLGDHRRLQRATFAAEHLLGDASVVGAAAAAGPAAHARPTRTFGRLFEVARRDVARGGAPSGGAEVFAPPSLSSRPRGARRDPRDRCPARPAWAFVRVAARASIAGPGGAVDERFLTRGPTSTREPRRCES
jgi:hypothetical protein